MSDRCYSVTRGCARSMVNVRGLQVWGLPPEGDQEGRVIFPRLVKKKKKKSSSAQKQKREKKKTATSTSTLPTPYDAPLSPPTMKFLRITIPLLQRCHIRERYCHHQGVWNCTPSPNLEHHASCPTPLSEAMPNDKRVTHSDQFCVP